MGTKWWCLQQQQQQRHHIHCTHSSPAVVILEVVNAPLCKCACILHLMAPAGRVALACLVAGITVDAQL
jgi:hypothetical protein